MSPSADSTPGRCRSSSSPARVFATAHRQARSPRLRPQRQVLEPCRRIGISGVDQIRTESHVETIGRPASRAAASTACTLARSPRARDVGASRSNHASSRCEVVLHIDDDDRGRRRRQAKRMWRCRNLNERPECPELMRAVRSQIDGQSALVTRRGVGCPRLTIRSGFVGHEIHEDRVRPRSRPRPARGHSCAMCWGPK